MTLNSLLALTNLPCGTPHLHLFDGYNVNVKMVSLVEVGMTMLFLHEILSRSRTSRSLPDLLLSESTKIVSDGSSTIVARDFKGINKQASEPNFPASK